MIYRDLREWISHLEKNDELLRIKEEIKLEPDVGAIGRAICDTGGPGVLAENIAGYETSLCIGLQASWARQSMAMGLSKGASRKEQKEAWVKGYEKYPLKAREVAKKDAPCKENIMRGDEVNLFNFPIPRLNAEDGGPYLMLTECITKDPDSDWLNVGTYRMQVLDRNKTSIYFSHTQHGGEHYVKARQRGKDLEMAVAIGTEPVLMTVSGIKIPAEWNEYDFVGSLRGEPMEVVQAESVDLLVPATAEIVLEGVLRHDLDVFEGPFGEFPGSYSGFYVMPVFEVKTITYRNNPIFSTLYLGRPPSENQYMLTMSKCAALELELKHRCPGVIQVAYLYPTYHNCVVQGRWVNKTEPRRVMSAVWSSESNVQSKMVTVVDEDVDPWNAEDVMWAIAARSQANTDTVIIPGTHCRLDPSVEVDGTTCKFGIDATESREPHPRHSISAWIQPREGTEVWKKKIQKMLSQK